MLGSQVQPSLNSDMKTIYTATSINPEAKIKIVQEQKHITYMQYMCKIYK